MLERDVCLGVTLSKGAGEELAAVEEHMGI